MQEPKLPKGLRAEKPPETITPAQFNEYMMELKRKPHDPIPAVSLDEAVIQSLIDLLIVEGVLKGRDGKSPDQRIVEGMNRYGSILSALIDLIEVDGLIPEFSRKMDLGILAFHHTVRHFGDSRQATFDEVATFRRTALMHLLETRP